MGRLIDLTGQKFGRLTVIELGEKKGNETCAYWKCRCDCGKETTIRGKDLRNGKNKSCGCLARENTKKRSTKHNMRHTPIYKTWLHIKDRCLNPRNKDYQKHYGGRGITICDEWKNDFQAFYNYVSQLEHFGEKDRSIDRINNDGNYEPGNVRWATKKEQANNRRPATHQTTTNN